jgi:hypothetical protein
MQYLYKIIAGVLLLAMISAAVYVAQTENNLKLKNDIQLQTTRTKLELKRQRVTEIEKELENTKNSDKQKTDRLNELEKELKELERQLEARRAEKRKIATTNPFTTQTAAAQPVRSPQGSCKDWMRQAGISDMVNGYELIMRESSCNPNAVNSSSGACGIAQALPCGKKPGQWNDPVNSMRWMQGYVMARYGSWAAAVQFHDRNNWY